MNRILAATFAALISNGTASASLLLKQYETQSHSSRMWLLGDWDKSRNRLLDAGISFQLGYVNELAYNIQGGTQSELASADQYLVGSTLDLERLLGIRDGRFQLSFTLRTGRNLSDDAALGTLQEVQEIFGRGRTTRLTEFWFEQSHFGGRLDWKIGRAPFQDFAAFDCNFQNLTFCGPGPGNLLPNYLWTWPISQWMTRLKLNIAQFGYIQVAIYDQNRKYLGTRDALLPVFFKGSTGALLPLELGWLPTFGSGSLQGSYKIGGWYDTSKTPDVLNSLGGVAASNPGVPVQARSGRFGGYLNFQQQIFSAGEASPGRLSVFVNAVIADARTSVTDHQLAAGFSYEGLFPGRPRDEIALAFGTTHVNTRIANAELHDLTGESGSTATRGSEYVFELYYKLHVASGVLIRPNMQYVLDPGGSDRNLDALVVGLKTAINF